MFQKLLLSVKVGRCGQIIELRRYMSIEGQGHFLTLPQDHLHMEIKTCFSQKPLGNFNQIFCVSF